MSRKDYQIIANTIADTLPPSEQVDRFIDQLCEEFKAQNPRFDADRFKSACS